MIVGRAVAKVSNSADGCTFQNESYGADISGSTFRIFDTVGLNEGDQGRVPHWKAIQELYTLIRQLDGVSLLVFCMRGRIRENTRANWILFNKVICAEKVPIIAVVTGLEDEANLDDWWGRKENKDAFRRYNMKPKAVGCIVSVRGDQNQYDAKYRASQKKLRNLIEISHRREPWSKEKEAWFARIYADVFEAGICFFARRRKEFTAVMRNAFDEFVKEVGMNEDDSEKLKRSLLKAEKVIEKGKGPKKHRQRTKQ